MKNFLLASALLTLSSGIYCQVSISLADMIQLGDTVTRVVDTMTTQTAGPSGANKSWVMTTATVHQTLVTKAMAPSSTPYASSYTNSNIAMTNDNISYLYGNQNSSTSVIKGAAGDLLMTGCNLNTPFIPDMLLHNFPRTSVSNFSDAYGIDITTTGSCVNQPVDQIRYKRVSMVYDSTDGWGTITTPVGTYQCLRIKKVDFSTDTTWIKLFPFSSWSVATVKVDTAYSYSWISKEGKLAIAELANDTLDKPKRFTWSQIAPFSASILSTTDATCGNCDGQASLSASGLYTPYAYIWSNGATGATATGLCGGNYTVTVSDNIGNSKILSLTINNTNAPVVTVTSTDASSSTSSDGSATAYVTGGTSPYTYLWNNGQSTPASTGLAPGYYVVTVTDNIGCQTSASVTIGFNVGIDPSEEDILELLVYPNPSSGKVFFSGAQLNSQLFITDVTGRLLFNNRILQSHKAFDVSGRPEGIYFYRIISPDGIITQGKFSVR